jgi:hypothetical protein
MIDMHRSQLVVSPFRWFAPRFERTVTDRTYFFGPFRVILFDQ